MSSRLEQIVLKMPHTIRTLAANYKSWELNRLRRGGNQQELTSRYGIQRYFELQWDEIQQEQAMLVSKLIASATKNVSFYQELYSNLEFDPNGSIPQLQLLPFLSKSDARRAGSALLDKNLSSQNHYIGHTSGSTGSPFTFYWTYTALQTRYAIRDDFYRFHGIHFDDEINIRIGGRLFKDVNSNRPPFWIYDRVTKQIMFSIYHMSDSTMAGFIAPIERFKPTFVTGYPSGIYTFARYCKQNKIIFRPKVVFTDSETVLDYQRELIEEVWQCPVRDYLGMEGGWVASQCKHGMYHINPFATYVEIIDEYGNPQVAGELGEIVVTDLINDLMPMIRYKTGDTAQWSKELCNCGWNTPVIERIEGRVDDIVVLPDGRRIGRLDHIFKSSEQIKECQIVQEKEDLFTFFLVPDKGYSQETEEKLLHEVRQRLGHSVKVVVQKVDMIPRTNRGKFRSVISKVK